MSLLLEALKKAELAKQAAKEEAPAAAAPPFTRDKLPDITQPMEIHSEDLSLAEPVPKPAPTPAPTPAPAPAPQRAPPRVDKPAFELALEEPPRATPTAPAPRPAPSETSYTASGESVERKQAQQVFEMKELDANPHRPFYITLGALGLFALGTIGYFWYQLHPRSSFAPTPPSNRTAPLAATPTPPRGPAIAAATVTPPTGTGPAPAAPMASATTAAPAATTQAAATKAAEPVAVSTRARSTSAPATTAAAANAGSTTRKGDITITPARVQADPVLEGAYQAFNADELARARDGYQQVLRDSPDSRDALLGLAAIEMQEKHYDAAGNIYTRLLTLDPRDAYAESALIGLKGEVDPLTAESRLKNMIAAQPEASFLQFTLGNQYAAQGRWAEAQQAYFRAYAGNPEHPDFAYNLAVSLDRLHQSKPALEYYRRALALAAVHPVSFDRAQVSKRVSQLAH